MLRHSVNDGQPGKLSGLQVAIDPVLEAGQVKRTALACDFASCLEDGERRNAADSETGGQRLLDFRVDLDKANPWFKCAGCLMEGGSHHPARATPRRPEVDNDGQAAALEMAIQAPGVQFDRFAGEKRALALAAGRCIGKTGFRHAIDDIAMRADEVQALAHGQLQISDENDIGLRRTDIKSWHRI